jgi:hypothetical protein
MTSIDDNQKELKAHTPTPLTPTPRNNEIPPITNPAEAPTNQAATASPNIQPKAHNLYIYYHTHHHLSTLPHKITTT